MKILYLLFAVLILAFLSQPGNAQDRCHSIRGRCYPNRCPGGLDHGQVDCRYRWRCCPWWKMMPSPSTTLDVFKIWPMT
ncbi:crotamine CRO1-like [Thamnophis elegans]|uniref:crotamine CRO1-like n=1 Tax=Thamnophis elegans TaxID=35005 RepID=UPI0013783059|nr:crotamine CRO1-like [Thamnophis elegans]